MRTIHLGDNRQHPSHHGGLDFTDPVNVVAGLLLWAPHVKNDGVVLLSLYNGSHGHLTSVRRVLSSKPPHEIKEVSDGHVIDQNQNFAGKRC